MSRRVFVATLAAVASLALAGGQSLKPTSIDPPAPPGSTSPALAVEGATTVTRGNDVLLTWLEPGDSGKRLMFARLSEQNWSRPVTVADHVTSLGPTDRPSLTVIETQAVRRTLIARAGDVVARSGDAGRTWARLPAPALPFASFAGGDEGAYVFWLSPDGDGSTKLLGTRVMAGETLLDPHVSFDSGTSAAMTWDGPVVVYRSRSAEGVQDIAMIRRQDARWTAPSTVHDEGGDPAPKPKSGPQVAALRRLVAVAWQTESPERPRVLVAFSGDAGRTFGDPVEVDAGAAPRGPVAVALDDDGHAVVVWMAGAGPTEVTLNVARVSSDGSRGEALVLAKGFDARPGGMPQIVLAENRVVVTWTEGVPGRVRAVAVPLAGIPAPAGRPDGAAVAVGRSKAYVGHGRVGEPAPDLELVSLDGEAVSLASLRGQAVLLNLWATWCLPCIEEMPELAAVEERYREEGLVLVGLNVDNADQAGQVREFASEQEVPFTVWLDPEMRVYSALSVKGLPATFVIDREGRIVWRRNRSITSDDPDLAKALGRALRVP